ncbi:cytochrome P450 [Artomyces pyxidatus]|uniref:Cytochrome P450 n=1 Tax=Artomyces pyxidatus TaxID=48021 RepID=A0ACB8SZV7_9AGAM|nr:cytochrome P450 [Artomyces pyxidatus]
MPTALIFGVLASAVAVYAYSLWRQHASNPRNLPYPPGPGPHFLLGNLHDLPAKGNRWLEYQRLSETYGSDVIHLTVLGTHILSINSQQAANDLLEKRSAIYSDRPRMPMLKELIGWDWNLVVMSYSEGFAAHRRLVQQSFQPNVVAKLHRPVMQREVLTLLHNLLNSPENFMSHLKTMAGAIIMMVTYGYQIDLEDDPFVRLAEDVRDRDERFSAGNLVDVLPILKFVPSWFPGAAFKREALYSRQLAAQMRDAPYLMVKKRLAVGTALPSMIGSLIEEKFSNESTITDDLIKNCGGVVYSAGADTTVAALANFFLAMTLYPSVQDCAQRELDETIGRDRLPDFDDRARLPSLDCLVKEVLRWKPVAALGVPHCTTADDEYRGMFIPKGTIVLANIYAMLHDESVYKDPDAFSPERFKRRSDGSGIAPDPASASFGFGRRICPGRFFATDSLWIAIANILHVFRLSKAMDSRGRVIEPDVTWSSGLVSMPSHFPCGVEPRFIGAEGLLLETAG